MVLTDWTTTVADSWRIIWDRFVNFLPNLIGAIVILVVGWIIGMLVAVILDRFFRIIGLQTLFEKAKVEDTLKKANIEKDGSALLASVAKWIIYLVAFIAAANVLQLSNVASFLDRILAYVPSVVAAGAILIIGLVVATFMGNVVSASMKAGGLGSAEAVSVIVRYAIIIFTFLAALEQLGIAQNMINTFFIGVVAFLAIAGGLAFGLGGKDAAKELVDKVKKELK